MSAQYPESGLMKEVALKYDSQENGFDLLDPIDNVGFIGFEK